VKEVNVVSEELLEILRCPNCVRDDRPNPGMLDAVGNWLICVDCDRKYPIRDDIPVMLIEEGDRFRGISREDLPEVPPDEERPAISIAQAIPHSAEERQKLLLATIGVALGVALVVLLLMWLRRDEDGD
jgi:uncharacterized protein YbaR (Trm112 family)